MKKVSRFSATVSSEILTLFDKKIKREGYPTRSKAIEDLMRILLIDEKWLKGEYVAAAIILMYDHHKFGLTAKLTDIQHDYNKVIISTQHIHLDHRNCMEVLAVKGRRSVIEKLYKMLRCTKGVKYAKIAGVCIEVEKDN